MDFAHGSVFVLQVVGKKGSDFHSESVSLKCTIEKFLST